MKASADRHRLRATVQRTLVAACFVAIFAVAASARAQDETSQPQAQPASPSDPPFWARPRPAAPDCPTGQKPPEAQANDSGRSSNVATGVLGSLVVVMAFLLWRQRRKPEEEMTYIPRSAVTPAAAPEPPPPMPAGLDPRIARLRPKPTEPGKHLADPDDLSLADPRASSIEISEEEHPGAESAGAQAFYSEIANTLIDTLHREPGRQDLRRKLLEVYFLARQTQDFMNLAHEYLELNRGARDEFWADIATMGSRLAPDHALFREATPETAGTAPQVRASSQNRRFHERSIDQGKLYQAQHALVAAFESLKTDAAFMGSLNQLLASAVRRPAPLMASPELAYVADGAQIFVKHEDRRRYHDDVLINAMAQMLLAQKLGRKRVVTATRDCVHGNAVATAAARLGMECGIYITERDLNRYYARVLGMRRLGAQMRPIQSSPDEPADPRRSAFDAWLDDPESTLYISGLTGGPSPYPEMVREFQAVAGRETAAQMQQMAGVPPTAVVAGMADGHLGLGLLTAFLDQPAVQLYCVEEKAAAPMPEPAGGSSIPEPVAPGTLTRREHRWLRDTKRVNYVQGDEQETLRIIEQFHATGTTLFTHSARTLAFARALARRRERKEAIVVLLVNQEAADLRGPRSDW